MSKKPKYKSGDFVILINGKDAGSERFHWINSLNKYVGKVFTVLELYNPHDRATENGYRLKGFPNEWPVSELWIEKPYMMEEELFDI